MAVIAHHPKLIHFKGVAIVFAPLMIMPFLPSQLNGIVFINFNSAVIYQGILRLSSFTVKLF